MKQIITSLILFLAINVSAQTTFTQSIVPSVGDVHSYKISKYNSSLNSLVNTTGSAVVWNYSYTDSTINTVAQSLNINYADTVGKPNEDTVWPMANLSSNEGTATKYSFYSSDVNSWAYVGEAFFALSAYRYTAYNSSLDIMQFPLNYTNTINDTATGNWMYNTNNMERTIFSNTTYDGYGTLNINGFGGFAAHRIYTKQNIRDTSVQAGGFPIAVYTKRSIYTFYDGVNKQPIVQVMLDSSKTAGAFVTALNSERILVNSTITGIKESVSNSLNVYPNPVNDVLTLDLKSNGSTVITICDITGKTIERNIINTSNIKFNLNVSGLASGSYLIKIENNGTASQQKFIKL